MKILVINAGSSSLKYQLIDMQTEQAIAKGGCERIGLDGSFCAHSAGGEKIKIKSFMPSHNEAIQVVLDALVNKDHGAISSMSEIGAVGHRIVHSGECFNKSVLITPETLEKISSIAELAPLHQPANIIGIKACKEIMPNVPMVGVFDTAFHSTMPPEAYIFALPYECYEKHQIRRYGFHGTSHKFVSHEASIYLDREHDDNLKLITLHLGNGSSIAAIKGGKSIDTSMSFTPLGGLPMGTRSGELDPAIIEYLADKYQMSLAETILYLNKQCGMAGLSGVSSDFRDLQNAKIAGNKKAELALNVFTYACKKYIGSYAAAMGGVDALVFTAGVGEHDEAVRLDTLEGLEFMGIKLDKQKNLEKMNGITEISTADSAVKILVIPTNEELVIARDTKLLVD